MGVVAVVAAPGSGKTTLLARAAGMSPSPVVWCTVGPDERDSEHFLGVLTAASARALGTDLSDSLTGGDLARQLAAKGGALLLLDDVHELRESAAESELADLLRSRPRHLRVVLGTRRLPAIDAPRLMVAGDLVELDSEALRFRCWEVEELFRNVYHEPLSPEGAAALTRRTGGWAAGLMLFHLSTRGKSAVERERAIAALGGRSRLVRSYLTRTVLDELEPERRSFLLTTCTLGLLTGPLCDELVGGEGSATVLAELTERQFFTTLADDGRSYRYHTVLQNLLEGLLVDELGTAIATDLYARSGALLEAHGHPREALRAHALAGDHASVARLLQASPHVVALEETAASQDDPWLGLVRARKLQRAGSVRAAVDAFQEASHLLDDAEFRRRCDEERATAAIWLPETLPGSVPGAGSGPRAVSEQIRAATQHLPTGEALGAHPFAEGIGVLLAGDPKLAGRRLARLACRSPAEQLVADLARVAAEIAAGCPDHALSTLEEIILTAEVEEQPWVARMAQGLQAAVLLVAGTERWRADSCESLVDECERSGDLWGSMLLSGALGTALALNDDPDAGVWLERAAEGAHELRAPVLEAWARAIWAVHGRRLGTPNAEQVSERARSLSRLVGSRSLEPVADSWLGARAADVDAARTRIRCFGSLRIQVDGHDVALPDLRPLPRSLLTLLALHHGREVHREVLIDLLWPGTSVEAAAHRLHAAASSVRHSLAAAGLGTDVVRRSGETYCLALPGAVLDVAEFEAHVREAARREAVGEHAASLSAARAALDLYAGDLLGDAGPAEWVVSERDRLRVAAANTAFAAARVSLGIRTAADALPMAHRVTEIEPLRDSGWQLLAEIQEIMGDFSSAAATRREHRLPVARVAAD